ncbi:MAG: response regulator [Chitinivibrionales bacterium]|nr:response regulator [Chitinivibrionales bacterium]
MRILLVDDSSTMRRIQKTQLNNLGVTDIFEAGNGEEGLEILANTTALDYILLDWNMPVMDGITFLKKVRGNGAYAGIKIIMCTSESEKTRVIEALKSGANDYIIKPFTPDAIKEKLKL